MNATIDSVGKSVMHSIEYDSRGILTGTWTDDKNRVCAVIDGVNSHSPLHTYYLYTELDEVVQFLVGYDYLGIECGNEYEYQSFTHHIALLFDETTDRVKMVNKLLEVIYAMKITIDHPELANDAGDPRKTYLGRIQNFLSTSNSYFKTHYDEPVQNDKPSWSDIIRAHKSDHEYWENTLETYLRDNYDVPHKISK